MVNDNDTIIEVAAIMARLRSPLVAVISGPSSSSQDQPAPQSRRIVSALAFEPVA